MCISKSELEKKIQEIKRYKTMAEEAAKIQKAPEAKVIAYMVENDLTEAFTGSAKITYKSQTRATLDKKRLEEDLSSLEEFGRFLEWFVNGGKETEIDGRSWDILGIDRSTRDVGTVHKKIDHLVALMGQYFKAVKKAA